MPTPTPPERSWCCKKEVRVITDGSPLGGTSYYECTACGDACDLDTPVDSREDTPPSGECLYCGQDNLRTEKCWRGTDHSLSPEQLESRNDECAFCRHIRMAHGPHGCSFYETCGCESFAPPPLADTVEGEGHWQSCPQDMGGNCICPPPPKQSEGGKEKLEERVTYTMKCLFCGEKWTYILRDKNVNPMSDESVRFVIREKQKEPSQFMYCESCKADRRQQIVSFDYTESQSSPSTPPPKQSEGEEEPISSGALENSHKGVLPAQAVPTPSSVSDQVGTPPKAEGVGEWDDITVDTVNLKKMIATTIEILSHKDAAEQIWSDVCKALSSAVQAAEERKDERWKSKIEIAIQMRHRENRAFEGSKLVSESLVKLQNDLIPPPPDKHQE